MELQLDSERDIYSDLQVPGLVPETGLVPKTDADSAELKDSWKVLLNKSKRLLSANII